MKNTILITILSIFGLFACGSSYAQEQAKKKVAVYMTGNGIDEAYKKVIGAKLVSAITESGEYAAVERTADFLAALSAENDYQTSGEVRDSQIAKLGQKFGVRYVVVADVSELFDEYFIAARMINVETGLVERAFDTNGAASSMAQLISLSKDVASGLLKGLSTSPRGTNHPQHLSLCVMDRNGKIQYLTTEQWQNMPESAKLDYTKKGVVISENGESFFVEMRDRGEGDWYWAYNNSAPAKWQLELIWKYKNPLNNALRIFGGVQIDNLYYWTNESYDSSAAWYVDMSSGIVNASYKTCAIRVRAVAAVPGSSAM